MDLILAIPILLRLVGLFVLGALVGSQLNRAIYQLAYDARPISPWSPLHPQASPRQWLDRIPILGWLALRRESPLHGAGFWVRPMLIELATAFGFAWLYYWETQQAGMVPNPPGGAAVSATILHAQFVLHVSLISLMLVATFIDFDEQTIPDAITVPGTVLALVTAATLPASRLPVVPDVAGPLRVEPLVLSSPAVWPPWLDNVRGLACGIACFVAWCVALLPWLWYTREGLLNAPRYFIAHIIRPPRKTRPANRIRPRRPSAMTISVLIMMVIGPVAIATIWRVNGVSWHSLMSSLVGLAFGGGLVWAVRIVGSHALGKEAMGFGDVTLMAMIGAFLGWQPALIVFFLAPFAALFVAILQWLLTRRHDIAFGPYLCCATLLLLLGWTEIWHLRAKPTFGLLGWLVPAMVVVCLALMAAMLLGLRILKQCFAGTAR